MRRTNPCYPTCTGPGRGEGCHATCPEWAKHDAVKFAKYEEHQKELFLKMDVEQHVTDTIHRMKRGKR